MRSHVVSIRDIDYDLSADDSYHSAFLVPVAIKRIMGNFANCHHANHEHIENWKSILENVLHQKSALDVWAVVLEYKQNPIFVLRNLAHTRTTLAYRRIYRVEVY